MRHHIDPLLRSPKNNGSGNLERQNSRSRRRNGRRSPEQSAQDTPTPSHKSGQEPPLSSSPESIPPESPVKTEPDKPADFKPSSSAKGSAPRPVPNRRSSWISSLSSKFSSSSASAASQNGAKDNSASPPIFKADYNPFGASFSPKEKEDRLGDLNNIPSSTSPKGPSFLSNALRKLSTAGISSKSSGTAVCERRVMNVDPDRDRCRIPELNQAKLKRVAFCVDVEIAGVLHRDEHDSFTGGAQSSSSKSKEKKKRSSDKSKKSSPDTSPPNEESQSAQPAKEPTRKQEKKKKAEEERKERKERKRRQAEADGSIPMQLKLNEEEEQTTRPSSSSGQHRSKTQSHPTTDPVRIYRRCCQLRETPVLKRLLERMTAPNSVLAEAPGTVASLDLSGFSMSLSDIVTFSDWLAIVPVRTLIMDNCDLTDEGVRSILAGLLAAKTMQQARKARLPKRDGQNNSKEHRFGVVERLSLKNNPKIGPEGWRHICLFIHLSKSLKAIDLSGVPFPKAPVAPNGPSFRSQTPTKDIASIFAESLANRFGGNRLEELLLAECRPSTEAVERICDAASSLGLRRLGLANNDLSREALGHVVRYLQSGSCEGIDLGGNDLNSNVDVLIPAMNPGNFLVALSLADCSLAPTDIHPLLHALVSMPNLLFVDLSHNPDLFTSQPDALASLRRYLPKMPSLKRIHLANVDLSPDHAIALAEVLPECPRLCHINILENPQIAKLASATDPASQEEACAVYASLMAATRVSRTLIAVDIEVPSAESNEVVKALASQIVAYSLRNLGAMEELGDSDNSDSRPDVPIPEVLQHLVGGTNEVDDGSAPDEDYVIGGTGVVKALGVCLGNVDQHHPELGDISRPSSGRSTPRPRVSTSISAKKPRDMSKNLLGSARNIRARIQMALVREDKAGNDNNYRMFLLLCG